MAGVTEMAEMVEMAEMPEIARMTEIAEMAETVGMAEMAGICPTPCIYKYIHINRCEYNRCYIYINIHICIYGWSVGRLPPQGRPLRNLRGRQ